MALSKIDVANMLTGEGANANVATVGVAKGGTGLTSGTSGQFLKFTGSTTLASAADTQGLSEVDMWRLISDFTQNADPITDNFERCDTDGFEKIGTGMSHSSGTFTFGATGIYKVTWNSAHRRNGENPALETGIEYSSNSGSSWSEVATCKPTLQEYTSTVYSSASCHGIIDVTNASTYRVRFVVRNASDAYTNGGTSSNSTYAIFEKLGDT